MRLIDADTFIEYLGLDAEDSREINLGGVVSLEDFDRQPTAYDVDKVVEQLRELNENKFTYAGVMHIVKAGGVNGQGITDSF